MRCHHLTPLFTSFFLLSSACGEDPAPSQNAVTPSSDMAAASSDMSSDMSTSSDMSADSSTPAPRPVSSGKTSCGGLPTGEEVSCQPSQYCADSVLNRCESGCLSDMNCPGNETCAKMSGQNSGFCQRKAGEEGRLPDEPSRTGATVCGEQPGGAEVSCQPSQYCADSVLNRCESGCLSDFNCPNGDRCEKDSRRSVGVCETQAPIDPCSGVTCASGQLCQQGQCVTNDPCAGVTCAAGQTCQQGQCMTNDPCAGVTCQQGQLCQQGQCVTSDPCAGVTCAAGQTCQQGQCMTNDPCAGVTCAAGQTCQQGQCMANTSTCVPNATAQDGCASDQICVYDPNDNPICFTFPACGAQNTCATGLYGAVCSSEFIAGKDPQCLPETCTNESHCPTSWKCVIVASQPAGFCDTGQNGAFCENSQDCQPGLSCDTFSGTCF